MAIFVANPMMTKEFKPPKNKMHKAAHELPSHATTITTIKCYVTSYIKSTSTTVCVSTLKPYWVISLHYTTKYAFQYICTKCLLIFIFRILMLKKLLFWWLSTYFQVYIAVIKSFGGQRQTEKSTQSFIVVYLAIWTFKHNF